MKTLLILGTLLIGASSVNSQISVDDPAPDFTHERLDVDDSITLSELHGKVVYIFFYGAECPRCLSHGNVTEEEIYQKYKGSESVDRDVQDVQDVIETELEAVSTGATYHQDIPTRIVLEQNYPNPFNPVTIIHYQIPPGANGVSDLHVRLEVFDALGRSIAELVNERQYPGSYSVNFDASSLPGGVYIYQLSTGETRLARQMMLVK
ncbi:MAG: T9SS type A sorting domain-containing protein [Balneolales bacterium]